MLSKRLVGAAFALALTALVLAPATAAGADPVHTSTATIKSTPDDGCPTPWARDSFERRTTITPAGEGTFKVVIADEGTFTTNPGAKSPADPATLVAAKVTGSIKGSGEFTVTGELRNATTLAGLNGKTFNNSAFPCKTDVPAERTTGKWPLQFFKDGAQASGIDPWTWTYTTACESMTESSTAKPVGNIVGLTCPAQITFTPATCDKAKSSIKVVNPNSHATLRVRFNGGPTHHVKAGQSHTHWFSSGSVQVKVNGSNVGVPYQFVAATGCATPTPTATADPDPTATATAVPTETPAPSGSPDPVPTISTSPAAGGGGAGLPLTGSPVLLFAGVGLLAVVAGGGLLVLLRRREPQIEV